MDYCQIYCSTKKWNIHQYDTRQSNLLHVPKLSLPGIKMFVLISKLVHLSDIWNPIYFCGVYVVQYNNSLCGIETRKHNQIHVRWSKYLRGQLFFHLTLKRVNSNIFAEMLVNSDLVEYSTQLLENSCKKYEIDPVYTGWQNHHLILKYFEQCIANSDGCCT